MEILHVYKDYFPVVGGIENHVKTLAEGQARAGHDVTVRVAEGQARAGHDVTVLVTNPASRTTVEMRNGVRVIKAARLGCVASTPLSLSFLWQLYKQRPDVTHLHFPYPVGEVAQYLLGRSRHAVLTYHSDVVRQKKLLRFYRPLMSRVLRSVDRIIVATPNYLESSPTLQPFRDKCRIVPYGIDQRPFLSADPAAVQALRRRFGGGPLLLFVGVLRYYKGLDYLLEAMPRIAAKLLIVGDGPMVTELHDQAQALGVTDRVVFVGRVSDEALPSYYGAADLFVLPASERSEAFGLVLVEAMSSGLPLVSTELGTGTSYVNRHGESGLVVPPKDSMALAEAINRLLADEMLRHRLAKGALARSESFSMGVMLEAIERVYAELTD
jgi:rhamnosyl/mannosyltransferase